MSHSHDHKHNHRHGPNSPKGWAPHKDWRVVTTVVLMLAAMAMYVLSLDEALTPGEPPQPAAEDIDAE